MNNNRPVADFQCDSCGSIFELKSKQGGFGRKIADGAYGTMIERITSAQNPDLFLMTYSKDMSVINMLLIPKFFFTPHIIEKRKPLAKTARRAGWVGCNILINDIPSQGKLDIIKNQQLINPNEIVQAYQRIKELQTNNIENRGWLFDVLNCINAIPSEKFSLSSVYANAKVLQQKHPDNHNVEAKIRQQLQVLRDKGFIEFSGRGLYKKCDRLGLL